VQLARDAPPLLLLGPALPYPLLFIGVTLFALIVAIMWGGSRLWRWVQTRRGVAEASDSDDDVNSAVLPAVLGLLALLLGFTFSLAVDRYETRRALVLEEANAIGTAYLQSQLLPEPNRARMSDLLTRYADNRIAMTNPETPEQRRQQVALNDRLITDLWAAAAAGFDSVKGLDFSSTFVSSMNAVIDLDTSRKTALLTRVPSEVFDALIIYVLITAALVGYVTRTRESFFLGCVMHALVVVSLVLILDIDRPGMGGITEPQLPMLLLQRSLHAQPPAVYDRWRTPQPSAR
jgi:hypothetical protein